MGNPLQHAQSSAKLFGGAASDYLHIHQLMDSSKLHIADWRHRALLHTTFGIQLMEQHIIGTTFTRDSDGEEVCTRSVIEQHIKEDMAGVIPTPADFLREMPISHWMSGVPRSQKSNLQQVSLDGSPRPPVIFEKLVWHKFPEDPPVEQETYLVAGSNWVYDAFWDGDSWLINETDDDVLYYARRPLGPT